MAVATQKLKRLSSTQEPIEMPIQIKRQASFTTSFQNTLHLKSASPSYLSKKPDFEPFFQNPDKKCSRPVLKVRPETPPPSPPREAAQQTDQGDDEADGVCRVIRDTVRRLSHDFTHLTEECADGVKDLFHKFPIRCLSHQESLDKDYCRQTVQNMGNNVHLPSVYRSEHPYRFGVHIKRADRGFRVAKLFENTIAHNAHLRESDIITHLDEDDLTGKELHEVLEMFFRVERTFKLTILREVHDGHQTKVIKLTIKITITPGETVDKKFEIDVVVFSSRYWSNHQTSNKHYISQDPDHTSQVYMFPKSDRSVCMGGVTDSTAIFVFEFYIPILTMDGQVCVIKNASTKEVVNCPSSKTVTMNGRITPNTCLFNKRHRTDGSYVFESVQYKGHFLTNSSGMIQLTRYVDIDHVPSLGAFHLFPLS